MSKYPATLSRPLSASSPFTRRYRNQVHILSESYLHLVRLVNFGCILHYNFASQKFKLNAPSLLLVCSSAFSALAICFFYSVSPFWVPLRWTSLTFPIVYSLLSCIPASAASNDGAHYDNHNGFDLRCSALADGTCACVKLFITSLMPSDAPTTYGCLATHHCRLHRTSLETSIGRS